MGTGIPLSDATQDRYATRGDLLLVLNCGSSSIKFALFDAGQSPLPRTAVWNGKVQGIGGPAPTYGETGVAPEPLGLDAQHPYLSALERIRERVIARLGPRQLAAVAHRVVHGGSKYSDPIRVDAGVLADLKTYIPLAPLHQPFALEAIERLLLTYPDLPQFACFDTGFHHTLPIVEQMLPLPYATWERGLRRYGFHGLSYEYLSVALPERHGELAHGRVIAALCSPTPAVNTSRSSPPSTATSPPISRTMLRTYSARAARARSPTASSRPSAASSTRGSADRPETPSRPESWYSMWATSSSVSFSISIR